MSTIDNNPYEIEQQSIPLKVTLPESLLNDLSLLAQSLGKSKTEMVRDALIYTMQNTAVWNTRCYFFQPNDVNDEACNHRLSQLEAAPKGTLIKVAGLQVDAPDRASILIGNLIRVKGEKVSFELPTTFRPTVLSGSVWKDSLNVKMTAGELVVPNSDEVPNPFGGQYTRFIYTIDIKYVWDIDTNSASFF